jgi:selenide, water dikinase
VRTASTEPIAPATAPEQVRLTQQVKAGGCAGKLAPGLLNNVLARLPKQQHPDVLVGFETGDDAGVFRLGKNEALVQTVDFFPPMVDDPFTFGRVAAVNALSDIYAMGARALTALAIVCFPQDGDLNVLEQIMRGGLSAMREADCAVVGGHSVRDSEMKFGYAVTGIATPDAVLTNAGAKPGDKLILTKALGTGVITTALKQGKAKPEWVESAVESMTCSNRRAAEIVSRYQGDVHAMTDVTGFGLMGHARGMALASGTRLKIGPAAVGFLDGALECVALETIPAGLRANRDFAECVVEDAAEARIPDAVRMLLYDPQTSGGLLMAVGPDISASLLQELRAAAYPAAEIGAVIAGAPRIVLC